ncbi:MULTISPECIES: o-succinylbenzoate--CoA ligase [Bacillaceae]|uniref:o-succinylbenzoate--CoA ligase n=1 Tax=Bacillaceae TaxID=186817 RepID=UPI0010523562|nr:o-succinylbenzoate--CoA ligase [Bacillus sp. CBEL-1]TDB51140.1 o-succinylbenzoate--CoA ligase [Bacillus sp. CBEL-1]USY54814.1 o-succinylbenzoate--CoA ligase [Bacillus sp. 1780r2a1]
MNFLPNWLSQRAKVTPNRIAIDLESESITFFQLHKRVVKRAFQLASYGIKKGHTVAIYMRNRIEYIELIHALAYIGAKALLLNTRLKQQEIQYQCSDAKASFLVADESYEETILISGTELIQLQELTQRYEQEIVLQSQYDLNDTYTIMYTSGTTGNPKGVMQSYGNHWWSATGSSLNLGLQANDCWLVAVPLFHISGFSILMRSVIYGMRIVLHSRFEAIEANAAIETKGVTIMSVVTSMLTQMLKELGERKYPESFRCMLTGGGPVPRGLLDDCMEKGIPVYQTYGMTETSSQCVTLAPEDSIQKLGSAGKPLMPCQLKIVNASGKEVTNGLEGEIVVKGPNVTPGYLNKPEETAKAIKDGWLYTGDIGKLDEDGFLYVLDRRSDLIISGGENIYPAEIESTLLKHPLIVEVGVTGVPDKQWGQVPAAFLVVTSPIKKEELHIHCQAMLANYKIPKYYFIVDELPRTASNKIVRRKLPKLIEQGHQL